ncbi:MAG: hypothetical protein QUS11_07655 [Candidatus Fermentibacter sp.]|nr:hypothetical protein [Candidatus Fermentibacter sp.]
MHTRHSDGTGSVEDVIEAAVRCGLDFVGINDHRTLTARHAGWLGMHRGVFVLPGAELEDAHQNCHILAYGIDTIPATKDTREQLAAIREAGGLSLAAHPFERGGHLPGTRSYGWTRPVEGVDGVEVWNYMSMWKAGLSPWNFRDRVARPDGMSRSPLRESILTWFSSGGCATGGPDAHALHVGVGRFRVCVFPYEMLFSRLRMHLTVDSGDERRDVPDERAILDSIRAGRCFMSNALLGDARGFSARLDAGVLSVRVPGRSEVVVGSRTGEVARVSVDGPAGFETAVPAGVPLYVEVLREEGTWIWCGLPCSSR